MIIVFLRNPLSEPTGLYSVSRSKCAHIVFLESPHLLPGEPTYSCSNCFVCIHLWSSRLGSVQSTSCLGQGQRFHIFFPTQRTAKHLVFPLIVFSVGVSSYLGEHESLSWNLKARPTLENDPMIQSQWSLCFLTFELCWVSRDLALGVLTPVPSQITFHSSLNMPTVLLYDYFLVWLPGLLEDISSVNLLVVI